MLNFSYQPETSIILPTYNRADFLPRSIESVLSQTYADWELIIVDDGSQDETFSLVDQYLQKNIKIRYLKHRNCRAGYSRNAGIQASLGQYIGFIDSDDFYKPDHLESRIRFMKSNPTIDLVEGGVYLSTEPIFVVDFFEPNRMINIRDCVLGATFFGKRNVFFELGGFKDLPYGEDTDFWSRAKSNFVTNKLLEPQTYYYEPQLDSTTTKMEAILKSKYSL